MFPDLNLTPLFYLAMAGLIALSLAAIGLLMFAAWFVVNHVQIV